MFERPINLKLLDLEHCDVSRKSRSKQHSLMSRAADIDQEKRKKGEKWEGKKIKGKEVQKKLER